MNKRRFLIILTAAILIVAGIFAFLHFREQARWTTFAECEAAGGAAWPVDLFHPDICPDCAAYRECESDYNEMMEKGIHFVREPKQAEYGMVAVFEDLYGNRWDLLQLNEDHPLSNR